MGITAGLIGSNIVFGLVHAVTPFMRLGGFGRDLLGCLWIMVVIEIY